MNDSHDKRLDDAGSIAVLFAAALVPILAAVALVVDLGVVYAERQRLQTGVEAAALAAAADWSSGGAACADAAAFVNDNAGDASNPITTCSTTGTARHGSVSVSSSLTTSLTFASMLGRDSATVDASATVQLGVAGAATGLRPIAICSDHPAIVTWLNSGETDSSVHRINIESDGTTCGGDVPGNWAMIDFDGGSNSNAELQDRVVHGYDGVIELPVTLNGDPGIPTPSIDIDTLIGEIVRIPVFADARSSGANAEYDLEGYVTIEIVDVVMTGAAAGRHIDVRFVTATLGEAPTLSSAEGYGTYAWRICSFDNTGECS